MYDQSPVSDSNVMDQTNDIKPDDLTLNNNDSMDTNDQTIENQEKGPTQIVITNDDDHPSKDNEIPPAPSAAVQAVIEALPRFLSRGGSEQSQDDKSETRILNSMQSFISNTSSAAAPPIPSVTVTTPNNNATNNNTNPNQNPNTLSPGPLQLPTRQRSMGSILSTTTTIDDVMSIDQSMLAHDGSRDGSVVPEQQINEMFPDDNEEIITASASTTNINIFPLPPTNNNAIPEEYNPTPDAQREDGATTIHSVVSHDISVDDIHHEAHQIINDLQQNIKEITVIDQNVRRNALPTIIQETDVGMEDNLPSISNSAILQPLIARNTGHSHGDGHDHNNHNPHTVIIIMMTSKK